MATPPEYQQVRTINMDSQGVVDWVQACFDESKEAYSGIRDYQDEYWNLRCNGEPNREEEEAKLKDWQSKVFIPKSFSVVRKGVSLVRKMAFSREDYLEASEVDAGDSKDALVRMDAQRATTLFHLNQADFQPKALRAVDSAFSLIEGILKLGWEPVKTRRVKFNESEGRLKLATRNSTSLTIDVVDPRNYFTNPDGTFEIERRMMSWHEAMQLAKGPDRLFDPRVLRAIKNEQFGPDVSHEEKERLRKLGIQDHQNPYRRMILVYEFYGPVYNKDGELLREHARLFIANEKYLLNPHNIDNPFPDQRSGYHVLRPIPRPFGQTADALIGPIAAMHKTLTQLYRRNFDGLLWRLMKLMQVVPEWLENPKQLDDLAPGDPIEIKPEAAMNGVGAILETKFSDVSPGTLADTDYLTREIDNGSGVPSSVWSGPPVQRDVTAYEIDTATNQAMAQFEDIAKEIERWMVDIAHRVKTFTLYYWRDLDNPRFRAMNEIKALGELMERFPLEQRLSFYARDVDFKCRGLTTYMEKAQAIENILRLVEIAAKIPEIRSRVPWSKVMEIIIDGSRIPNADQLKPKAGYDNLLSELEQRQYVADLQARIAQAEVVAGQAVKPPSPEDLEALGVELVQQLGLSPEQAQGVMAIFQEVFGGAEQQPQAQAA